MKFKWTLIQNKTKKKTFIDKNEERKKIWAIKCQVNLRIDFIAFHCFFFRQEWHSVTLPIKQLNDYYTIRTEFSVRRERHERATVCVCCVRNIRARHRDSDRFAVKRLIITHSIANSRHRSERWRSTTRTRHSTMKM